MSDHTTDTVLLPEEQILRNANDAWGGLIKPQLSSSPFRAEGSAGAYFKRILQATSTEGVYHYLEEHLQHIDIVSTYPVEQDYTPGPLMMPFYGEVHGTLFLGSENGSSAAQVASAWLTAFSRLSGLRLTLAGSMGGQLAPGWQTITAVHWQEDEHRQGFVMAMSASQANRLAQRLADMVAHL